jgi:PAS domain S-box-containing protein
MLNLETSAGVLKSDMLRLVEAVPGLGWAATAQGRIIHLSGRFQELLHGSTGDVEHFVWTHLVGEPLRERVSADWHDAVSKTRPFQASHRLLTLNGPRWMRSTAQAQLDESGRQVFWLGTSIDIDDTMGVGKLSRRDSTWMKALIDTVPAPIWSADPGGEPTYINRALATQTGIAIDDLEDGNSSVLAAAIASAIHPDDMEMVGAALGRSFATGEPFRLKYRKRRADGSFGWIRGEAEALRDADGAVIQWYGVCYDIDNEVKAEESLRSAHEALTKAAQFAAMAELSASIGHDVSQPLASTVASADACLRRLSQNPPNHQRALRSAQNAFRDANAASEI